MTLNQIIEKLKMENAQSMEKHGKWKGRIDEHRQSEAIRNDRPDERGGKADHVLDGGRPITGGNIESTHF